MNLISPEEQLEIRKKSYKQLMYVGIFSIVMMFGGLSSAYVVLKTNGTWVKIFPPTIFYWSTLVIVISSFTYLFAVKFVKKGKLKPGLLWVSLTLILGVVFSYLQFKGWKELTEGGNYFGGNNNIEHLINNTNSVYGEDYIVVQNGNPLNYHDGKFYDQRDLTYSAPVKTVNLGVSNHSSSYFFLLTGLHLAHLIGGLLSLLLVWVKCVRKKYSENDHIGIKVSAIYWHFLDFLWLYLLGLLYFVG